MATLTKAETAVSDMVLKQVGIESRLNNLEKDFERSADEKDLELLGKDIRAVNVKIDTLSTQVETKISHQNKDLTVIKGSLMTIVMSILGFVITKIMGLI